MTSCLKSINQISSCCLKNKMKGAGTSWVTTHHPPNPPPTNKKISLSKSGLKHHFKVSKKNYFFFVFFLTPPLERVEGKCNAQKVLTMASVIMFLNYSFIPSCSISEICHHYIWYSVLVCINNTIWWVSYRSGRGDQENRNKKE